MTRRGIHVSVWCLRLNMSVCSSGIGFLRVSYYVFCPFLFVPPQTTLYQYSSSKVWVFFLKSLNGHSPRFLSTLTSLSFPFFNNGQSSFFGDQLFHSFDFLFFVLSYTGKSLGVINNLKQPLVPVYVFRPRTTSHFLKHRLHFRILK